MMKKYLRSGIIIFIICILGYLTVNIITTINHKKKISRQIAEIPTFTFKTLEGSAFSNRNLIKSKNTLFIYFNSECDFCNTEAESIRKDLSSFKNTQLIFVSNQFLTEIQSFAEKNDLLDKPNITFLQDSKKIFKNLFDVKNLPYCAIYDQNLQLKKKFEGPVALASILKHL